MSAAFLGLDLGTSGMRLAIYGPDDASCVEGIPYPGTFEDPTSWREGLITLCQALPRVERQRIRGIAVDGTSGTLLLCRPDGSAPSPALSCALPYSMACPQQAETAERLVGGVGPAASASGSLARAMVLLERARRAGLEGPLWLRHQADWLMGWLLGNWRWGEETNNLRLGWNAVAACWSGTLGTGPLKESLPEIVPCGRVVGRLDPAVATLLGLPDDCSVVSGSTDASAAVLAADPQPGEGITVLGTTLVLKQFCEHPLEGPGISCQRLLGRWLVGGASNAGAGVLRRFFDEATLVGLSRQIDPERDSGLALRPLPAPGERFPVDDPNLTPVLEPRPVSDALYLQGLLEGLALIERQGWARLQDLGCPSPIRIVTLGGGAANPQWRRLRERILGIPVVNRPRLTPALGMARLAAGAVPG